MTHPDLHKKVDCAVIVVTYNSARDIGGFLDSLPAAAAGRSLRVIVVDNGSTDDTVELVRNRPGIHCIENQANLGYSGGVNVGRQHAGEFAALGVFNPDLILEPGAIDEMLLALDDLTVGVAAPATFDLAGARYPSLGREPTLTRAIGDALFGKRFGSRPEWLSQIVRSTQDYNHRHPVDWASGAALLISAECDRATGAWDERFFLYMEEVDYAARVRAGGLRVDYVPGARVRHRGGGSGQSPELCALMAVSRVRYMEKYRRYPRAYRIAVFVTELLRSIDPSHRAAMRAVARRSTWVTLVAGLKAGSTVARISTSPAQG